MGSHDDEFQSPSESTPLLGEEAAIPSRSRNEIPARRKQRAIFLLTIFAFTIMLGDNLQPAAFIQVLEDVICDEYYKMHPATPDPTDRCKAQPVQKELALVQGYQQLVPVFAVLLCTVPYGLLAERIGRRRVLILCGTGICAAVGWGQAVFYWRFLSIRWIWLSGAFLFIGGGAGVAFSLVHVMVTDITEEAERAQFFLIIHSASVAAGLIGPAISAVLMEKGYTWTVLLLSAGIFLSTTFLLTPLIPETLHLRGPVAPGSESTSADTSSLRSNVSTKGSSGIIAKLRSRAAPLLAALASNRQASLLLLLLAPQIGARELFGMVGLQFSSAKFSLRYSQGNVLLSLFQAAQAVVVLVLFPLITRLIAEPRGWTTWARDRRYAIASMAVIASGLMVIAVAPGLVVEIGGLVLVAFGSCATPLLMSLLGEAVRPDEVSAVYSIASTLSIVVGCMMGPVVNGLLAKGLELGWAWMGLPFGVVAALMALVTVASVCIPSQKE